MDKPISIMIDETKKNFVETCNNSLLPISIIELILTNLLHDIHEISKTQLDNDLHMYADKRKEKELNATK